MGKQTSKKPVDPNQKDLKVHHVAFRMLRDIEEKFPVDEIALRDGTRLWNLLRIIIFYHFQKKVDVAAGKKRALFSTLSSISEILVDYLRPMRLPKKARIYGFSRTESRKLWNGKYYDIYLDPLSDVLGEKLCVCEWPDEQGRRRKYQQGIYSKQYIPMHIPLFSKTFWNIVLYKILGTTKLTIENKVTLDTVIQWIAENYVIDRKKLKDDIDDSIIIFAFIKDFLYGFLQKANPSMVLIRCGYGRFPMALSQACKQLHITSAEIQHGFLNMLTPGYVKSHASSNHDCIADYFLAYGEKFAEIVRQGNLFDEQKVVSIGFPYLEKIKESEPQIDQLVQNFKGRFKKNILVTSDSLTHIAEAVNIFVQDLASALTEKDTTVGIIFKPHPLDGKTYDHLKRFENICVVDKYTSTYDLFKVADIHTTVFSTSAIEALSFGIPNILLNVGEGYAENIKEIIDDQSSSLVSTVDQYIEKMNGIFTEHEIYTEKALEKSEGYFRPQALKNFREFLRGQNMDV
jgi:hypothetical protein